MIHHKCVYVKHRAQKPSFPEASITQSRVAADLTELRRHWVPTGPDSHTRTRPRKAWWPISTILSLPTASVREGSRLTGHFQAIFKHCHIKPIQLSSKKVNGRTQTKPVFTFPLPHPQHILNNNLSWCPFWGRVTSCSQWGLLEAQLCLWLSPSPWWVWLVLGVGVQSVAPTQESLQHLVWEPGTLRRQTRGWATHPPSQPRGKQRRTRCKRRKSNLSWVPGFHLHLPGHGSVDWQWGWVGLPESSRDGIYRLTLPEVTEERNPSMTKHELPTSSKSLMRGERWGIQIEFLEYHRP